VDLLREFFSRLFHVKELLTWGGYPALMLIIFAETGLLIGFFLPGDSLLVTAGVLVSIGEINPLGLPNLTNLLVMNAVLCVMAIAGDTVGYAIGYRAGPKLFSRDQSFFFRKDHLVATQKFYDRHGGKTIVLARFMPFARTFAPVVAGIGRMSYARFLSYNVFGGIGWIVSMTFLGYFLAGVVGTEESGAKKIEKIIMLIVVISVAPPIFAAVKQWRAARRVKALASAEKPATAD
jgi:membrane-associated protein